VTDKLFNIFAKFGYKFSSLMYSNVFEKNVDVMSQGEVFNNLYLDGCRVNCNTFPFHHNEILGQLDVMGQNQYIESNLIRGEMWIAGGYSNYIINNHFFSDINIGEMEDGVFKFLNNNMAPETQMTVIYNSTIDVENNNFSKPIHYRFGSPLYLTNIKNNNYYPYFGSKGQNIKHIDPLYVSDSVLVSQNTLLIGKGINSYVSPLIDIDSIVRAFIPTIGANELCISVDTVEINCGDALQLLICNSDTLVNPVWTPNFFMSNDSLYNPIVKPYVTTTYVLNDGVDVVDSIVVVVNPFILEMPSDKDVYCGYAGVIYQIPNPLVDVSYSWSPNDSVFLYDDYKYYANPIDTTTYILTLTHDYCGVYIDSVTINLDQSPVARGRIDSIIDLNQIYFKDLSRCADSVKWFFGDGETSTEFNPLHVYNSTGIFYWTVEAYNEYGSRVYNSFVFIDSDIGIGAIENANKINLFPNPNNGVFTLFVKEEYTELKVLNSRGQSISLDQIEITSESDNYRYVELIDVESGMYFLKIKSKDNSIKTIKFIVE
jgi:hypothetical protein